MTVRSARCRVRRERLTCRTPLCRRERTGMLERAEEFSQEAKTALNNERYHAAALCCYVALFWAAIMALEYVGVRREEWSHDGLRTAFIAELVHKRRMCPAQFGDWLRDATDCVTVLIMTESM